VKEYNRAEKLDVKVMERLFKKTDTENEKRIIEAISIKIPPVCLFFLIFFFFFRLYSLFPASLRFAENMNYCIKL
jgi:hypothetical protein